jgi:hypothetical protein
MKMAWADAEESIGTEKARRW